MIEIKHSEQDGIFILYEDGNKAGEMTYVWEAEDRININHTLVDKQHAGKSYGKKLVLAGIQFAQEKAVKIVPSCWYAEKILRSKTEYSELIYK